MQTTDLRIALFSGNYNYTRDGANKSLNRLVGYLLSQGAAVRVYSPVVDSPAFAPTGDLVGTPSIQFPGRPDYQLPLGIGKVRADLDAFAPNLIHVSAPEILGHSALRYARKNALPVVASVHTRFDTYFRYYRMGLLDPVMTALLRRFYRRCDALLAPSESFAHVLREQRMHADISIWSRGVETDVFAPQRRSPDWRQSLGIGDDELVIGFVGRLVFEKGLDVFADVVNALTARNVPHRVLVIGKGPAEDWFRDHVPGAVFAGFQSGADLGRAVASLDVLLNPSVTETFGNVTLEAMASGVAVVGADATGTSSLVADGVSGRLIEPRDIAAYADAIEAYARHPQLRAEHGAAGAKIAANYTWDRINQTVADTYLRIINGRA